MRFRVYAGAMLMVVAGVVLGAQGAKVTTPEELDKVMKKAGPAMQAAGKAMGGGNYADVKAQLAIAKQAVADSQSFWIEHRKEDAIKFNKDTLAKIDAVEKLLAAPTVDAAAAAASFKEVGASCRSCHQQYRATDAENNFILKPGSIGG